MSTRFFSTFSCIAATSILSAGLASAATVTYTDSAAWSAAATGNTTIDFTGLAPSGSFKDYGTSTGLTASGVNFLGYMSATSYQLSVMDSMFAQPYYNFGGGATLRGPGSDFQTGSFTPYIHVVLPGNVTSIAANLASISPNGLTYSIKLSDGETFSSTTGSRPNATFFGLTTDAPISYVDFALSNASAGNGSFGLIKTFQFATAGTTSGTNPVAPTDTPEACTMILIGTGLVAFRAMKKKGFLGLQQA